MGWSIHQFPLAVLFKPRWSTIGLLGSSLGVGVLAYYLGAQHEFTGKISVVPSTAVDGETAVVLDEVRMTPAEIPPSESPMKKLEDRWRLGLNERRTPAVDQEKIDCLVGMAGLDPNRAMVLALGESDFRLRDKLRDAVLRGWAARFPDDAATWALRLPPAEQHAALEAVLAGAASRPQEAVRLGRSLGDRNPELAGEYGQLVITALTELGAYEPAVSFAEGDGTSNRAAWLNAAFFHWASHQPEAALKGLGGIADPAARSAGFQGMVTGWAAADPVALADFVTRLSPGADRAQAFSQTLPEWVSRDPLGASEWMISRFTPSLDLDAGVASVASLPNLIADRPEVAVGWAENIAEPLLRTQTLRKIAREWAQRDAAAVRRFIAGTPNLPEEERRAFLDGLNSPDG